MSGIFKRRIFFSQIPVVAGEKEGKSVYRFTDFAICTTNNGPCFEPFIINDSGIGDNNMSDTGHDPLDMMRRVDEINSCDYRDEALLVSDEGTVLHAHNHWVRVGP